MTIIADSGGLFAGFDAGDEHHAAVADFLAEPRQLVVPPLVLAELDYMIARRAGEKARARAISELIDIATVAPFTQEMFQSAADLAAGYGDIELGLTDASVMVTAYEYRTRDILTVDQRHFRAVRPPPGAPGTAFRLLPFDAQA